MTDRSDFSLDQFIQSALHEDVQGGDHTSLACIMPDAIRSAELRIKEAGVLAGMAVAKSVFHYYDATLAFEPLLTDGQHVQRGQLAFKVHGPIRSILTTERLVLNLMQRMSGVATTTSLYAKRIAHTKAKVLDTRKTTPGLRWFEKEAVRIGGGMNHRFGLYDMILIKDNHVDGAGSISSALDRVNDYLTFKNLDLRIELEVRNFEELEEGIKHGGLDRIMLDNFSVDQTQTAVDLVNGRFELESSGGITLETVQGYAETGVDFISVGALTHSVKSLDLSLKLLKG